MLFRDLIVIKFSTCPSFRKEWRNTLEVKRTKAAPSSLTWPPMTSLTVNCYALSSFPRTCSRWSYLKLITKLLSILFLDLRLKVGLISQTTGQFPTRLMDPKTSTQKRALYLEFQSKSQPLTLKARMEKLKLPLVTSEEKPVSKALAFLVIKTKGKVRVVKGLPPLTVMSFRSCLDLRVKPESNVLWTEKAVWIPFTNPRVRNARTLAFRILLSASTTNTLMKSRP
mgnify:CR=1 FL=1